MDHTVTLSRATVEQLAWTLHVLSEVCGQVSSLPFSGLRANYRPLFKGASESTAAASKALSEELQRQR